MTLLSKYKGRGSSLSLFVPRESIRQNMKQIYFSTRNPLLDPYESKTQIEDKSSEVVRTDTYIPQLDSNFTIVTARGVKKRLLNYVDIEMKQPENMPEISDPNFDEVFKDRIECCTKMCNFDASEFDFRQKEIKIDCLRSIHDIVSQKRKLDMLKEEYKLMILDMVKLHVFRSKDRVNNCYLFSDDFVSISEPMLPHLDIVYDIYLGLVENWRNSEYISKQLILDTIDCFWVPDHLEREKLAKVVFTYAEINHQEARLIMDICCNIIIDYLNGFKLPHCCFPALLFLKNVFELNPRNKTFRKRYKRYIFAFFSAPHYQSCHSIVDEIVHVMVEADQHLSLPTIKALTSHWPTTRSGKLVQFIQLLLYLLSRLRSKEFREICKPVFKLLADASVNANHRVADAAFVMWKDMELASLIVDNSRTIFPTMFVSISKAVKDHWSQTVIDNLNSILEVMCNLDQVTYNQIVKQKSQFLNTDNSDAKSNLIKSWAQICRSASVNDKTLNTPKKLAEIQEKFAATPFPSSYSTNALSRMNINTKLVKPISRSSQSLYK